MTFYKLLKIDKYLMRNLYGQGTKGMTAMRKIKNEMNRLL